MASVITSNPIVFNCFPKLKILKDRILDLISTLVSWAKMFKDPFVNNSSLIANDLDSFKISEYISYYKNEETLYARVQSEVY